MTQETKGTHHNFKYWKGEEETRVVGWRKREGGKERVKVNEEQRGRGGGTGRETDT